jgi:hypothetical protein
MERFASGNEKTGRQEAENQNVREKAAGSESAAQDKHLVLQERFCTKTRMTAYIRMIQGCLPTLDLNKPMQL